MSKSPEAQLEEFLASKPAWMQKYLQTGFASLNQDDIQEWCNNLDDVCRLKDEYERTLQLIPAKWREYRKRLKRDHVRVSNYESQLLVPKGTAGRPIDSKAKEYFEQHSGDSSYADIAKQELQSEPESEAKTLLIPKERERIRASVRRSRRRQPG